MSKVDTKLSNAQEARDRLYALTNTWKQAKLFGYAEIVEAAYEGRPQRELNTVTGKEIKR